MAGFMPLTSLERLRVTLQEIHDSERTVLCSPEWESRIKTLIAASPCAGLWTVTPMPGFPDDRIAVLDHHAAEASARQGMQRALREPIQFLPEVDWRIPLRHRYPTLGGFWPRPQGRT